MRLNFLFTGDHMDVLSQEYLQLRSRICNAYLVLFTAISIPVLATSLYRIFSIGWQPVMALHIILVASLLVITLYRNHIPYHVRVGYLLATFISVGLGGIWSFGLVAGGIAFIVAVPILCAIFLSLRSGLIIYSIVLIIAAAIGMLIILGYRQPAIDTAAYAMSTPAWALAIFAWIITSVPLMYAVVFLNKSLTQSLDTSQRSIAALQSSEETLEMVLEGSQQGFWDWNIETGTVVRNERWANMLGYKTIKDFEDNTDSWTDNIHPDDRDAAWAAINDHLEGRTPVYKIEYRMLTSSGEYIWILDQAKIVKRDAAGKPLRMCGTHTDISYIKQQQQEKELLFTQLQQAQKMESIGQLAGGIAHDFNNMLSAVLGYAYLSIKDPAVNPDSKLARHLQEIQHAAERGRGLVSDLLAFGRPSPVELKPTDGKLLITDVIKLLSSTLPSSLDLDIEMADPAPSIQVDSSQIHQVITNLIINAYHAAGEHGHIGLKLRSSHHVEGMCSSCHQEFSGDFVELCIYDDGQGIPEEQINHVFEPFFTTKVNGKGSGMGLAMVHGILHSCDAHILVESTQGRGTNFRLLLQPTETEVTGDDPNDTVAPVPAVEKKRIMVVDDEAGITAYLEELLSITGYEVCAFTDSQAALEAAKSDSRSIDLVITDQTMPHLTGAELAQELLTLNPDLPVILCSGYSESINETKAKESGILKFIKKPVDPDKLLSVITALLQHNQEHRQ